MQEYIIAGVNKIDTNYYCVVRTCANLCKLFIVVCQTLDLKISYSGLCLLSNSAVERPHVKYYLDSSLWNTSHTGQSRFRYHFQIVKTPITTAYCKILPALDHHV